LVTSGAYRSAFCAVRPPGHHCGRKGHTAEASSQGYCIINNVAVGGFYAIQKYNYKKIAIVDFDVHHGNGTEEIVQNNDKFFFVSIHVGEIYPGTGADDANRANNILNISLASGDGSSEFRSATEKKIIPALDNFKPDLLILSSGFDGHKSDPTDDGLKLEEADYTYITDKMVAVADRHCGGKIVSVLEGGYDLGALGKCVKEHVVSLLKKSPSERAVSGPSPVSSPQMVSSSLTPPPPTVAPPAAPIATPSTPPVRVVTSAPHGPANNSSAKLETLLEQMQKLPSVQPVIVPRPVTSSVPSVAWVPPGWTTNRPNGNSTLRAITQSGVISTSTTSSSATQQNHQTPPQSTVTLVQQSSVVKIESNQ